VLLEPTIRHNWMAAFTVPWMKLDVGRARRQEPHG
jgi:hypothetical protein